MRINTVTVSEQEHSDDSRWVVSVVFWCTLFIAAALYAVVALAPKFERILTLRREHTANQWQLVALEDRVRELDRVAAALQTDERFAAELARSRFGVADRSRTSISVSDELQINTGAPPGPVQVDLPWYYGIVSRFASSTPLRATCLSLAGGLVLFGFGFLHERYAVVVQANLRRAALLAQSVGRRYTVATPGEDSADPQAVGK